MVYQSERPTDRAAVPHQVVHQPRGRCFLRRLCPRRASRAGQQETGREAEKAPPRRNHAPKLSRAAAEASSSLSGMIFCTESTKVWPLQCMGTTTSGANVFSSATT